MGIFYACGITGPWKGVSAEGRARPVRSGAPRRGTSNGARRRESVKWSDVKMSTKSKCPQARKAVVRPPLAKATRQWIFPVSRHLSEKVYIFSDSPLERYRLTYYPKCYTLMYKCRQIRSDKNGLKRIPTN